MATETARAPRPGEAWECQMPHGPYLGHKWPLFRVSVSGNPAWVDPFGNVLRDEWIVPLRVCRGEDS
jgi:hypothetical protein